MSMALLFMTHQIAGPMKKLENSLWNMCDGKYPERVTFRDGDHFSELLIPINKLNNQLKKKEAS